jgi:YNFM family putative membrane transporter
VFCDLFNYATFRLSGAPYSLSQTQISLIFLSYSFGMVSSSLAGSLADRFGKNHDDEWLCPMIVGSLMTLLSFRRHYYLHLLPQASLLPLTYE